MTVFLLREPWECNEWLLRALLLWCNVATKLSIMSTLQVFFTWILEEGFSLAQFLNQFIVNGNEGNTELPKYSSPWLQEEASL